MRSFDQSLKLLLQQDPADFIRFALRDRAVQVLEPLPSGRPTRGRDVDGGYRASWGGAQTLVRLLSRWMGAFDEALQERLRHVTDPGILEPWLDEAVGLGDPKAAQRLAKKIRKGLPV